MMPQRRAEIRTTAATRYLQQLCKHWSHKFSVEFTPTHGEIMLPFGPCLLDADQEVLTVIISSPDAANLPRFQQVVEEHIKRFAFRETLAFPWTDAESPA
jgi:uncharacterized protein